MTLLESTSAFDALRGCQCLEHHKLGTTVCLADRLAARKRRPVRTAQALRTSVSSLLMSASAPE